MATNGTDLWCCACQARLVRKVERTVLNRIVGYITEVHKWAPHKQLEFEQRQTYVIGAIK